MTSVPLFSSTSALTPSSSTTSNPPEKNIKRKLEDAIHSLDEAVGPSLTPLGQAPPSKRMRTGKSLYATLAKYGIKKETKQTSTNNEYANLSKIAPHLAAILSRTATRTRKTLPLRLTSALPSKTTSSATEYRPSSMQSFLSRLSTFKLTTYANKPPAIDAVAAARCGWVNDGKDRLACGICDVSWVVAGREGMSRDAANALVEKQRASLVDMHKDGCPWKTRQCDPTIYRIPLQSPLAMAREIKSRATALDTVLEGVEIKHPLTTSQIQSSVSTLSSVTLPTFVVPDAELGDEPHDEPPTRSNSPEPSEIAIVTSLFGWAILPPAPPSERARTQSLSRANSVAPSTPARALSRAPSVMSLREGTPTPSSPRPSLSAAPSSPIRVQSKPDTTLLHCALCQRRIGLWAFISPPHTNGVAAAESSAGAPASKAKTQPRRQLDVLREHRSYCPYVVRSTVVPSLSSSNAAATASTSQVSLPGQPAEQPGAVEGWRAVLTVVLRHGLARRQRLGRSASARRANSVAGTEGVATGQVPETPMELDSVEAMVAGVKSRGGKDLLKYVKGLLG